MNDLNISNTFRCGEGGESRAQKKTIISSNKFSSFPFDKNKLSKTKNIFIGNVRFLTLRWNLKLGWVLALQFAVQ